MVGYPYDFLSNPLGAVRSAFDKAVTSGSDPTALNGRDFGAVDLFRDFLSDDSVISQVPILNAENIQLIQPNTLVRFRGMIQDMLGNEFYAGAYKDGSAWRTNKYTDVPQFPMDSSCDMLVWERRLLYCVPVPGQNSWALPSDNVVNTRASISSTPREKRHRDDNMATDDMEGLDNEEQAAPSSKKMRDDLPPSTSSSQEATVEKTSSSFGMEYDFDSNSLHCLVKVYDSPETDLKLNENFEFIGVLSFDPVLGASKKEKDEFTDFLGDDESAHLPSSKVPRLHCLIHRKLGAQDFLPSAPLTEKTLSAKEVRQTLLEHLTSVLGNDGLAAQFILLHLLSGVHARVDTLAVGKLSLNLTGLNSESVSIFGNRLNVAIKNLLPFTHYMPLSVDYLNNASLSPKKDYQQNRLVPGVLQLAEGSHLMIDETQLQAGTLNSIGVENARSLTNLMESQKVEYDFTYYKMEMPADVQILVLSEGKSNILPADLVLPFHPNSTDLSLISDEILKAWRWYLASFKSLPHTIEPEMQKVVEDDIVAARQADRSLDAKDFSRLLTMGRLMSASFGETSLSLEHWQMVKELERLRRERLK